MVTFHRELTTPIAEPLDVPPPYAIAGNRGKSFALLRPKILPKIRLIRGNARKLPVGDACVWDSIFSAESRPVEERAAGRG